MCNLHASPALATFRIALASQSLPLFLRWSLRFFARSLRLRLSSSACTASTFPDLATSASSRSTEVSDGTRRSPVVPAM